MGESFAMKIRKRIRSVVLLAALSTAAACGNPDEGGKAPGAGTKTPDQKEPVTLAFYWPYGNEETFMKDYGDQIRKKFPHVTAKLIPYKDTKQIDELVMTGEQLDVMAISIGSVDAFLLRLGLQSDITPYITKYKTDLNQYEPASIEILKQIGNGQIYGLPIFDVPSGVYYNKDIFDKFGVPYPKDGMTWDTMYETAKRLTVKDGGTQYYGALISASHLALRNPQSMNMIEPVTNKAALATDGWKGFLDNVTRFYQLPGMEWDKTKLQVANQGNMFMKDRTVAMWLPVSALYTEKELEGMNWDLAAFPTDVKNPGVGPQAYPFYMFVSQTSKHKEPAYEVISYLASPEFQLELSKKGQYVSMLKNKEVRSAFGQNSALYKGKNAKAFLAEKNAPPMQISKYNASAGGQLFNAFISVVTGVQDANTALRIAEETVNKTIEADSKK